MNPKLRAAIAVGTEIARGYGVRSKLRQARQENDRLALADAMITAVGLITGIALAIRELRRAGEE